MNMVLASLLDQMIIHRSIVQPGPWYIILLFMVYFSLSFLLTFIHLLVTVDLFDVIVPHCLFCSTITSNMLDKIKKIT